MTLICSEANTASNESVTLLSRSWMRKSSDGLSSSIVQTNCRAGCVTYARGTTGEVNASSAKLDEEEDVQSLQKRRFHG